MSMSMSMRASPTPWEPLLTAIEDGLDSFPPVLVDALPADPGPVPLALVDRAVRVLRRMAEAEVALEQHRAEIGQELVALSAVKATAALTFASPVPRYLDTKA
jgi:hypothetical protein